MWLRGHCRRSCPDDGSCWGCSTDEESGFDRQRAHAGQELAQELFRLGESGEVSGVPDESHTFDRRDDFIEIRLGQAGQYQHIILSLEDEKGDFETGALLQAS